MPKGIPKAKEEKQAQPPNPDPFNDGREAEQQSKQKGGK
jgi:hypothetical protein